MPIKISPPDAGQYLDPITKANLDRIKTNRLGQKYDYVLVIVADKTGVGLGKSALFHECCAYIDPDGFTIDRVLFDGMDYRMIEGRLKSMDAFGFDEPDAFFSTEAMSGEQRKLKLKFSKIRQKRHFIVICAPSLTLLAKWFRGAGESRVNCVFRIVRRGVFYAYGDKTGSIKKIDIDQSKNKINWPESDFIGFFRKIPEDSVWWEAYLRKKNAYLKQADDNPKAVALMKKEHAHMQDTLTLRDISEIHKVSKASAYRWYKCRLFSKSGCFIGFDGQVHVKMPAYRLGMKKIMKMKQLGIPFLVKHPKKRGPKKGEGGRPKGAKNKRKAKRRD